MKFCFKILTLSIIAGSLYFQGLNAQNREDTVLEESWLYSANNLFSQPGVKFMHKLRSLEKDATIKVENLPEGLTFNQDRNLVEGLFENEGVYNYTVLISSEGQENRTPVTVTVSRDLQQPTPFMGWLSWNVVESDISTDVVKAIADAMESSGIRDAGYNYLVIDDLWQAETRADDGSPIEDSSKFPNGMKEAADYAHSKKLKFGIYSDAGDKTCGGAFGSYGFETQDANKYAEWGVDLLKYDYCNAPTDMPTAITRYSKMNEALKATDRDIVFYICEWGQREPWKWGSEAGGSCWRSTYDTRDCWDGDEEANGIGILQSIKNIKDLWTFNGVNRWNDADMMCVGIHGNGKSSSDLCISPAGMTMDEYGTQFALWCMWSSPLTLSFDLREPISKEDLALITNSELIALDQDRMGQAAELIDETPDYIVFAKDLENGDVAVSVTNLSDSNLDHTIDFSLIPALDVTETYNVRDLMNRRPLPPVSNGKLEGCAINPHATVVYRFSK